MTFFETQARACERLGSPFTARLCRLLAETLDETTATGRHVAAWPGNPHADALALRLCGALHALVLNDDDEALAAVYPPHAAGDEALEKTVGDALARHDAFILAFLDSAPQTNEIARSSMLLPGLLMVARETGLKLALCEIGASAGLNLNLDRFHYRYDGAQWGDPGSPVQLGPQIRGAKPPLEGKLDIVTRAGCDRLPVNIAKEQERLRLRSYIWPDQPERMARLNAAISVAQATPFRLDKIDAAEFVERELAARPSNAAFVLYHSIMWQYLPEATKSAIGHSLDAAGREATARNPLAWLRMEPVEGESGHAVLTLTTWPQGRTRRLARCDFHGRWIAWEGG